MRIISGCMRPTETTFLPVLAGITPPDIRREARVAKLTETAKNNPEHLHHKVIAADAACPQRLVSRHPFSRHAARLSNVTCACGHTTQSVQHVVVDCMIHKAPDGFAGLRRPDAATRSWLKYLNIEI